MNKVIKRKWLAALRSGEYIQGKDRLVTSPKKADSGEYEFCCLGVLQNVYHEHNNTTFNPANFGRSILTAKMRKDCSVPIIIKGLDIQDHLITLNDIYNWSFKEIANWVEKNL